MSSPDERPVGRGELTARELVRWTWRQVTSMRTALVLLLLLALAAIPGSVVPQAGVDAIAVTRWKDEHPDLTPIYEKLDLFSVYDSIWFSAIYLLLVLSLVGCIVPRLFVYARAFRAQPPPAPRNLSRLPDHSSYETALPADEVLARARAVLGKRYRLRKAEDASAGGDAVSAERGYLREAGNLLFHLSVLIVLAGFAIGGLFGYQGGVILVQGSTFGNNLTQYDDFDPGGLFTPEQLDEFDFTVEDFDVEWVESGAGAGTARGFRAGLSYREGDAREQEYNLRVNHPLSINDTDVFLIGHGYAPVITIRDGEGNIASTGPTPFLPQDQSFVSFGVVKTAAAEPGQIGLEGLLYPTFYLYDGDPASVFPDARNPLVSMLVYTGDLGLDTGESQSIYVLDKSNATQVTDEDGKPFRVDLSVGETVKLPDGLGSVTLEGVKPWVRVQISQTPGKEVALLGVVLALIGLCGSLYVRPRRVWVRARTVAAGDAGDTMAGRTTTVVEVAGLDRSGNGDLAEVLADLVADLKKAAPQDEGDLP
ncbi:cytochrome c biogenesis protein ResB [Nocardioides immobilis]|uniref:Cytochrome c biogenesis protein ResB n=1 Tax=Nocardioides immobilis TaxID=2049295 RepID=A0A417Y1U9_9ACTN|nr:cytochrome c biogenesis protein ResB [Nocardioides immobilis]RHW26613.1 cytochrome c biogenesis protein ResB [Nocardioides immobilis]